MFLYYTLQYYIFLKNIGPYDISINDKLVNRTLILTVLKRHGTLCVDPVSEIVGLLSSVKRSIWEVTKLFILSLTTTLYAVGPGAIAAINTKKNIFINFNKHKFKMAEEKSNTTLTIKTNTFFQFGF